jgi:hypothetical protein
MLHKKSGVKRLKIAGLPAKNPLVKMLLKKGKGENIIPPCRPCLLQTTALYF